MDHLRRLIYFSLGVFIALAAFAPRAKAETIPATPGSMYAATRTAVTAPTSYAPPPVFAVYGPAPPYAASKVDACALASTLAGIQSSNPGKTITNVRFDSAHGNRCAFDYSGSGGSGSWYTSNIVQTNTYCANGGTFNGSACIIPAGYCVSGVLEPGPVCATYTCPSGGTLEGTTCTIAPTCPSTGGWTLSGTSCTRTDCAWPRQRDEAGACGCPTGAGGVYGAADDGSAGGAGKKPSGAFCLSFNGTPGEAGCMATPGGTGTSVQGADGSWSWWSSSRSFTGAACTQGATPADPKTETDIEKCAKEGKTPGYVNGQLHCVAKNPNTPTEKSSVKTTEKRDASGAVTETTTTTTTEICTNGSCNTTTITETRNASGALIGKTTETKPGGAGPGGDGAGGGTGTEGGFGGSCDAGFTCSGDPIQCAIALEQHRRNCQLLKPSVVEPETAFAEGVYDQATKRTGIGENFLPETEIEAGTLNTTARINAGQCPSPVTVNTPLGAVVVDLTILCEPMRWFGFVILFAALLVAARVTIGGIV